jgi:hypothetical protein
VSISVPAFERRADANPKVKSANAIRLSFCHMIDAFLFVPGLNQRIAAKLQKSRRSHDHRFKSFNCEKLRNYRSPAQFAEIAAEWRKD